MQQKNEELLFSDEVLISKIFYIRGHKVMLDRDLAGLFDVKPIRLREQVKRNLERFPENFMLQLTVEEVDTMVSQFAIPSKSHMGGHNPYVFTEHGVLMLANVLRSNRAIQVSIRLIEIFVKMREMLSTHKDVLLKLEQLERKSVNHDTEINLIFEYLKKLINPSSDNAREPIGFTRYESDND